MPLKLLSNYKKEKKLRRFFANLHEKNNFPVRSRQNIVIGRQTGLK